MITEYAGLADRQVGSGIVHEVHAWWNAYDENDKYKRAAVDAVREHIAPTDTATFEHADMDTYNSPRINALIRVRVRTAEEVAERKRLAALRYTTCEGCGNAQPGYLVQLLTGIATGEQRALCYGCWRPLTDAGGCRVLHWIQANGRLQLH